MDFKFFITSFGLGVGLAMDACAVSMANGLNENKMKFRKTLIMAFMFGLFQGLMPLIGYFVGHAFIEYIEKFIPWIALGLLVFLGIKMIVDGVKCDEDDKGCVKTLTAGVLFVQGIATSIDALSVGFTIANYKIIEAIVCAAIICLITFGICVGACIIGKKFGNKLGNKAIIFGGVILIIIGLEIFLTGIL